MRPCIKQDHLLPLAAGMGGVLLALRGLLETLTREPNGLLLRGHPLTVVVCLLIPLVSGVLGLGVLGTKGKNPVCPASPMAAIGCLAAALGGLLTVLPGAAADSTAIVWKAMGCLAAGGMLVAGWCRWKGKQPPVLCYLAACLFLLSHLVAHYRGWCADPQVMDYLTDLLAVIAMMLFCYYCAALAAGNGSAKMQLWTGLLSVFLGVGAVWNGQCPYLYLGFLAFAATNLCRVEEATP